MMEHQQPSVIRITEVGPRDGLQNERAQVPLETKVRFINGLSATGVSEIEVGAFVSPKAVPQMKDTDEVFRQIHRTEGVTYTALVPNEQGLDRALAAGADKIAVFTAASNTFNQHNIHAAIPESIARLRPVVSRAGQTGLKVRGYISTVVECPYEGRIAPETVLTVMRRLQDIGVEEIALGETLGKASPHDMRSLLETVCAGWPPSRIALHLHDTYRLAIVNAVMAWEQFGITHFDGSAGGLGGCPYSPGSPGNVATEDLVRAFKARNAPIAVDEKKVVEAFGIIAKDLGRLISSTFSSSPNPPATRLPFPGIDRNRQQRMEHKPPCEAEFTKFLFLWNQAKGGNLRAVSRLISMAESNPPDALAFIDRFGPSTERAAVIGITGYPGAGKSTLINGLAAAYRAEGKKVGILAVDTSSPFSGGAILGDRIRMHDHSLDPNVYIRSMATRGNHGGLAQATGCALKVLVNAGFDVVLLETVGMGQEEGDIARFVRTVVVVVAPGLGDEVQAMKAGLFEIAHVVVVNKADRDGADATIRDLQGWVRQVVPTVAEQNKGIHELIEAIAAHQQQGKRDCHVNI